MHANARIHGLFHAGQHVCIARDEDDIRDVAADGGEHHVRDEAGVHRLLRAPVAPFDELAAAQLHAWFAAQGTLVAVRPGLRDAVVPKLSVNRLFELVLGDSAQGTYDLRQVDL